MNQHQFNESLNISYVDPSLETVSTLQIYKHYFASILLYGLSLFFVWHNHWYGSFLQSSMAQLHVKTFLLYIYLSYVIFALPIYLYLKPRSLWNSKPLTIICYLKRVLTPSTKKLNASELITYWKPNYQEQQAILLHLVKLFFGPQMVHYAFGLGPQITQYFDKIIIFFEVWWQSQQLTPELIDKLAINGLNFTNLDKENSALSPPAIEAIRRIIFENIYILCLKILFFIDTTLFALGYFWEANLLKNRVRTVDNTAFGILICLATYPPFNSVTSAVLSWVPNDTAAVNGYPTITWIIRGLAITLLCIYASASMALFTKASNLTNRGTVSYGPYAWVRHPAYTAKIGFWCLTSIPFFFPGTHHHAYDNAKHWIDVSWMSLSILSYALIYYFRAITEERHLLKDPEYQQYCEQVRYRFIPKLW